MLSYMNFDSNTPLDEQYYNEDENVTWADFFHEQTMQTMRNIITLCGEAEKENYELTDTDRQSIENTITNVETYAETMKTVRSVSRIISRRCTAREKQVGHGGRCDHVHACKFLRNIQIQLIPN